MGPVLFAVSVHLTVATCCPEERSPRLRYTLSTTSSENKPSVASMGIQVPPSSCMAADCMKLPPVDESSQMALITTSADDAPAAASSAKSTVRRSENDWSMCLLVMLHTSSSIFKFPYGPGYPAPPPSGELMARQCRQKPAPESAIPLRAGRSLKR